MAACVQARTRLRKVFAAAADLASPEVKLPLYSYIAARGATCRTRLGGQSGEALGLPKAMRPHKLACSRHGSGELVSVPMSKNYDPATGNTASLHIASANNGSSLHLEGRSLCVQACLQSLQLRQAGMSNWCTSPSRLTRPTHGCRASGLPSWLPWAEARKQAAITRSPPVGCKFLASWLPDIATQAHMVLQAAGLILRAWLGSAHRDSAMPGIHPVSGKVGTIGRPAVALAALQAMQLYKQVGLTGNIHLYACTTVLL